MYKEFFLLKRKTKIHFINGMKCWMRIPLQHFRLIGTGQYFLNKQEKGESLFGVIKILFALRAIAGNINAAV